MGLVSQRMTKERAIEILNWTYETPYNFYNNEVSDAAIRELLNGTYRVITDENGELIGFYCAGDDARVFAGISVGAYDEERIDVGFGMKPNLTGQGYGLTFCAFILDQVREHHQGKPLRLTVATFNKRAIRLYEKLGFRKQINFYRNETEFMTMVKD